MCPVVTDLPKHDHLYPRPSVVDLWPDAYDGMISSLGKSTTGLPESNGYLSPGPGLVDTPAIVWLGMATGTSGLQIFDYLKSWSVSNDTIQSNQKRLSAVTTVQYRPLPSMTRWP